MRSVSLKSATSLTKTHRTTLVERRDAAHQARVDATATHLPHAQPISKRDANVGGNVLSLRIPASIDGVSKQALADFIASSADAQWFTGKGKTIANVSVAERARLDVNGQRFEVALLNVKYEGGGADDVYHVPLL